MKKLQKSTCGKRENMIDFESKPSYGMDDLVNIVAILRAPGGCPWDQEQTHQSIRQNMLEEAYEACEAIDQADTAHLKEELGDVLLQVALHAQMEREQGSFTLDDVADGICKKLIFRHPHVFGDVNAQDVGQALNTWDAMKRVEKSQQTYTDTLEAVARSLPALWRAQKVQKKAKKAGFDWPDAQGAVDKLSEELSELRAAMDGKGDVAEELGDLLFACVNVSRFVDVEPEEALTAATDKFISRFALVERKAQALGRDMKDMTLAELDQLWDQAKDDLKDGPPGRL